MALSQRLEFRQSQALVMTPQLMQAIKLLQLSSLDLVAYVDAELERNPLLERGDDDEGAPAAEPQEMQAGDPAPSDWSADELEVSRSSMEQGLGTELENVFPDEAPRAPAADQLAVPSEWAGIGSSSETGGDLEAFVAHETTLADHLAAQMAL